MQLVNSEVTIQSKTIKIKYDKISTIKRSMKSHSSIKIYRGNTNSKLAGKEISDKVIQDHTTNKKNSMNSKKLVLDFR